MKAFKLYVTEGGTKLQLKWLGALLVVIGITISTVALFNYFQFPVEPGEEFAFSARALIIKELYVAAGVGVLGVIFLLAGTFSADSDQ